MDDIVLISSCPYQLQRMLNTCQSWCNKARIEINTEKTKIVHFYKSISIKHGHYHPQAYHWHILKSPQNPNSPRTPLLEVENFKYLGITLDQELTMKPLQQQIIESIIKSNGKLQGLKSDLKASRNLYSLERSSLGRASTSPKTSLHLWKSCVLVQATQYIRYVCPTQLSDIQTQLQKSLQNTFDCYSQPTNLMCDLGVPPIQFFRHKDLTRLHYRFSNKPKNSLLYSVYMCRIHNPAQLDPLDLEAQILHSAEHIFPLWKHPSPLPQPHYLPRVLLQNREKSFAKSLNEPLSRIWRKELNEAASTLPLSRLSAYISIAGHDINRNDLFHPAQYINSHSTISVKALLRLRTQHSEEIPTHQHLDSTEGIFQKTLYTDRKCPACSESLALPQQPPPPIRSEEHLLFSCPHTPPIIMTPFIFNINRILRQLRKPEWKLIPPHHQLSIALGSTPPPEWKLKVSQVDRLNRNLLNHCALLALRLSEYAKTLH